MVPHHIQSKYQTQWHPCKACPDMDSLSSVHISSLWAELFAVLCTRKSLHTLRVFLTCYTPYVPLAHSCDELLFSQNVIRVLFWICLQTEFFTLPMCSQQFPRNLLSIYLIYWSSASAKLGTP